ncbi:MAG: ParA family protein [Verrucomicrobia bacterium]|nr:ParA family protein [Verrucomicrobiota bacterium]
MSTKVLAFINFKGGVGKTACAVNIAATLAKLHEKKVLVVDLDPQSNSSLWLMRPDQWREHVAKGRRSTFEIFDDAIQGKERFNFAESVVKGVVTWTGFVEVPQLHLLPASVELLKVEDRIHELRAPTVYRILERALKDHLGAYDYVFFDCPPNLYSTTKNAIFLSDSCIVPYIPDYLSLSGFQVLAEYIAELRGKYTDSAGDRRHPNVGGVIVSHYRQTGNVFRLAINELEIMLAELRTHGILETNVSLLQPFIRHCVRVAESTSEHLPVVLYAPGCIGAQDYSDLTQNFLTHFHHKR